MLKQRIITAVILATVFLAILFALPSVAFTIFIVVAIMLAAWEWSNMAGFSQSWQRVTYLSVVFGLFAFIFYISGFLQTADFQTDVIKSIFLVACCWWAIALLWVQTYPNSAILWGGRWLRAALGLLILIPAGIAFIYLRMQPLGAWLILLVVGVVVCADVGAYFSGKAFGKHKLAPAVSPGKTWEGFWGGVLCNVLLAVAVASFLPDRQWLAILLIILPTSFASVLGDLVESMIKRHRGIKDSSHLLPGHGGIMDRFDSLSAAAPVFALVFMLSGWQM